MSQSYETFGVYLLYTLYKTMRCYVRDPDVFVHARLLSVHATVPFVVSVHLNIEMYVRIRWWFYAFVCSYNIDIPSGRRTDIGSIILKERGAFTIIDVISSHSSIILQ